MEIKNIKIEDVAFGSSIQEITVPDALKKRIPCGLDYFQAILGGEGLPPRLLHSSLVCPAQVRQR